MNSKLNRSTSSLVSILLVVGLTLAALTIGWVIKESIENQTSTVSRNGITAQTPKGWLTQYGIEGEGKILSSSDPFNANHSYTISQYPSVPGGQMTDSVVMRNLQRAQELPNYQVLDQSAVKLSTSEGYRVTYTYVQTPKFSKIPVVMMGVDYYQMTPSRVIVISLEDDSTRFDQTFPAFLKFLNSLVVSAGG